MQQVQPQIYIAANILAKNLSTYNQLGLFTLYFSAISLTSYFDIAIFIIKKAKIVLGYAGNIQCTSYFGWNNRY